MISKEKVYNPTIDFIRLVSILAVVMIHTSTRTIEASANNLAGFPLSFILNQLSRFAVPLFFLISGFVLELNYSFHRNYFAYLKKRLSRILTPFVFWSAIYFYFIYTHHSNSFLDALLYGSASYQLYFIPTLIIFYLIFPVLHRFRFSKVILLILGIIQIIILSLDYYFHVITLPYPLSVFLFNYFTFILGIYFCRRQPKRTPYLILIISAIYVIIEGYTRFNSTHNYLSFYSQWRPSILIYTISLFFILYQLKIHHPFIQILSRLSFFVFFIHIIILELIWPLISRYYTYFGFDFLFFSLVIGISFGLAYLVHRIPRLNQLTG